MRVYRTTLAKPCRRRGHGRGRMLWVMEYRLPNGRRGVIAAGTLDECRREVAAIRGS